MRISIFAACVLLASVAATAAEPAGESNWERFKRGAKEAGSATWDGTKNVAGSVAEGAHKAGDAIARGARKTGDYIAENYEDAKEYVHEKTANDNDPQPLSAYPAPQTPPPPATPAEVREALEPPETLAPAE